MTICAWGEKLRFKPGALQPAEKEEQFTHTSHITFNGLAGDLKTPTQALVPGQIGTFNTRPKPEESGDSKQRLGCVRHTQRAFDLTASTRSSGEGNYARFAFP